MARAQAKAGRIKVFADGIEDLLKSDEIEGLLFDIADEIVRDAKTLSGRKSYKAKAHRVRKSRTVINIVDTGFRAKAVEAKYGWLAKVSAKNRD